MTTNIGSHVIQEKFAGFTEDNEEEIIKDTQDLVFEMLRQTFRPEFLNRIDEAIMFRPLSKADVRKIVDIQFRNIQKMLNENEIKLEATDEVLNHIAEVGFDPQYGARPLKRILQREILNELSKKILSGKVRNDSIVGIDLDKNNHIKFINLDDVDIEKSAS
jgi:ATP-dependent Clp protease ATP-binding subunit ClpB